MSIEKSAKTVDEAVKLALEELNATIDLVDIKVIEKPKSGFLGFGARNALVSVSLKEKNSDNTVKENKENKENKEENKNNEDVLCSTSTEDVEKIKNFLSTLVEKMGTDCEILFKEDEEALNFYIENSKDFNMLIGKSGETLDSISYLLNIFTKRNCNVEKRVYLDINGYKVRKEENIRKMAMAFAKKAIKYKKVMRLRPMNAYERRIVHSTIHNMKGVFTVSEGEEPYRKVVIKPKF